MGQNAQSGRQKARSGDRLAKIIARNGACSRREAESWIVDKRVSVNGKLIDTPNFNVTESDTITIDGEPLQQKQGTRLWMFHKPAGKVVTERDPEGRPTIFEDFEALGLPRVLTVGRLDINTEGLLLLTNDGGLKRVLELPRTGWLRKYRVRAHGRVTQDQLSALRKGMEVEGTKYGPIEATLEREQGGNVWINVALREGKNREVKIVLGALGLLVNRLIRVSYGPFQLADLPVGQVTTVKSKMLADQLGKKLAAEAGVDFDAPMPAPLAAKSNAPVKRMVPKDITQKRPRRAPKAAEEESRTFDRDAKPQRRVLFSDGRQPEYFEPQAKNNEKGREKGGGRGRPAGRSDGKSGGKFGDKPRSDFGARRDQDRSDRPQRHSGPRDQDGPGKPERRPRFDRDQSGHGGGAGGERPTRGERPARSDRPTRAPHQRDDARRGGGPKGASHGAGARRSAPGNRTPNRSSSNRNPSGRNGPKPGGSRG